jgi:hypothetical protein
VYIASVPEAHVFFFALRAFGSSNQFDLDGPSDYSKAAVHNFSLCIFCIFLLQWGARDAAFQLQFFVFPPIKQYFTYCISLASNCSTVYSIFHSSFLTAFLAGTGLQ